MPHVFADHAPAMCRSGWAVLPAAGKSPIPKRFNRWGGAPSFATVEGWAEKHPDAAIAFVPGLCSSGRGKRGVIFADCDDSEAVAYVDENFVPTPGRVGTRRCSSAL